MADDTIALSSADEDEGLGAVSAANHAFLEQKKRLRLTSSESDIGMGELNDWTIVNHHRAIMHLLSCLAGVEVWTTSKTSNFHVEQRMLEAYGR